MRLKQFFTYQNMNNLLDVFERWKELTLIIEPFGKEISDTFDISVKIPINQIWKKNMSQRYVMVSL